jgi:tricarballylate dehydrogenase
MENRDMSKVPHRLVVVGHGAAGLTAAVAAAEAARSYDRAVDITLVEKATQEAAGGNTLWSRPTCGSTQATGSHSISKTP